MTVESWTIPQDQWHAAWHERARDASLVVMAERPEAVVLSTPASPAADGPWTRGHVFAEETYLQWRQLGDHVRVVAMAGSLGVLHDDVGAAWPEPAAVLDLSEATSSRAQVVLWGRQQAGEDFWLEMRIPHIMQAPNHHPPEATGSHDGLLRRLLVLERYSDPATGSTLFQRYCGLITAHNDENDTILDPLAL